MDSFVTLSAMELTAPPVPSSGADLMPADTGSFWEAFWELASAALRKALPDLAEAGRICYLLIGIVLLLSILQSFRSDGGTAADLVGTVMIGSILLGNTRSLVSLAAETIVDLTEYGKLLIPVMTTAMAAQGSISTSAALYTGSTIFNSLLATTISRILIPMVYVLLTVCIAGRALKENSLTQIQGFLKWLVTWSLKTLLYIFTGYMSITGVVSGSADALKIKATKLTISGMVPVVGGILSDASEAVLVSAGIVRSAAGVYGIFAILSVCLAPFLRIGIHYLLLKGTAALCSVLGKGSGSELIRDFSGAMGLLAAMTGSVCLLLLISSVCFLREVV